MRLLQGVETLIDLHDVGGAGNDTLCGEAGDDTYLFQSDTGQDIISDSGGSADQIQFGGNIGADQLWFRRSGTHLEVSLIGTADKFTVQNWYAGSAYRIEQFKTTTGRILLEAQVESLVQAMAAFAPPAAGQTSLPTDYRSALAPVIAANWQS